METIRILVLTYMYPNKVDYNSGVFVHNQATSLQKENCLIKVISPIPRSPSIVWFNRRWRSYSLIPANDIIDGTPVYYPRYIRLPGKLFHSLACYSMSWGTMNIMRPIIDEFKPHVIHAHMATPIGYVGLMLRKKYHIPLVCSLRGSDIHTYPAFQKHAMRLTKKVLLEADRLVSVSDALKKEAEKIAQPKKEINVVYNGCDLSTFFYSEKDRRHIRGKIGMSMNDKVIVFVGRMLRSKGVYDLFNAFVQLASSYPNLHLLLVGSGPEFNTMSNEIYSQGLSNKVHMTGNLPHNGLSQWLSASDIFVLPSHNEGLPNVVLEAMACGLPVIASRTGGIPEAIDDGKSGILTPMKDVSSLIHAVRHLLNNDQRAKRMGDHGARTVARKFSWERNAEEMLRIYREVIA